MVFQEQFTDKLQQFGKGRERVVSESIDFGAVRGQAEESLLLVEKKSFLYLSCRVKLSEKDREDLTSLCSQKVIKLPLCLLPKVGYTACLTFYELIQLT